MNGAWMVFDLINWVDIVIERVSKGEKVTQSNTLTVQHRGRVVQNTAHKELVDDVEER